MNTWKKNMEETKQHYIDWWNHKGIVLNMWEHFQEGVTPHADVPAPAPPKDLNQKWFDPEWRAAYLDWYVAHSSLLADMLPVANTQLGPGSLAAILGGVFEGGEDTIWIHPNPNYTDDIKFDPDNNAAWKLHKDLLRACKEKAQGHYYVGMPDLMEGLDVVQEAGAEQISLSRDVLHFTRQGGEDRLTFSTNGTGVTCETDISAPWVTYDLDENQHLVTVSVKANEGNSRTVKLILRQGNSVAGVTVVQAGMARFWIPFLPTTGQTNIFRSIIDYETAQHSTQLGYNKADGEETIEFIPESEYFSKATYTLGDDQTMYEKVTTTFTSANVTHKQEFITKLVEVGFVKDLVRSQSAERVVYKLKNNPALSVLLEKKDDVIRITYAYTLQFATFPFNNYIGEAWQTVKAKVEETGAKEVNALDWDSEVDYYYSTSISGVTHYYTENKSSHEASSSKTAWRHLAASKISAAFLPITGTV